MKFDARAALAEVRGEPSPCATHAIRATRAGQSSTSSTCSTPPEPKFGIPAGCEGLPVAPPMAEIIAGLLAEQAALDRQRAFRASVAAAFADYAATDDPRNWRAWA